MFVPSLPGTLVTPPGDLTITATGYEVRLAAPVELAYAQQATLAMTANLFRLEAQSNGQLRVIHSLADVVTCFETGVVAAILHFEGADALDPELDALEVFYRAGLRSLGLVWSRPNAFGHGVPFRFPASPDTGPGLTEAGFRLVDACNRLGILLDVSHLNERGFWDLAARTAAPIVATHSAAHALCPSSRNLTDRQLAAIRESDGLVGLNFEVSAVRPDSFDDPDTPLEVYVRQIDYLVERLGIDGVAFGSDFDGATMPQAIGDVAGVPRLVTALEQHGYDATAIRKLTHANWLRVLRQTWRP